MRFKHNLPYLILFIAFLGIVISCQEQEQKRPKDIGIMPGHMPEQPIAFSHKVHAEVDIDCRYCHTGERRLKPDSGKGQDVFLAPSVSICINCHRDEAEVKPDTVSEKPSMHVHALENPNCGECHY